MLWGNGTLAQCGIFGTCKLEWILAIYPYLSVVGNEANLYYDYQALVRGQIIGKFEDEQHLLNSDTSLWVYVVEIIE